MRRAPVAVLVALLLGGSPGVPARARGLEVPPAGVAGAKLDRVRAAVGDGSVLSVVQATAAGIDISVPQIPAPPAPTFRAAVRDLVAAVRDARSAVRRAVGDERALRQAQAGLTSDLAVLAHALDGPPLPPRSLTIGRARRDWKLPADDPAGARARLTALQELVASALDSDALYAATARLAAAVDRAMPLLNAVSVATLPKTGDAACDIVHQPGTVCIGGSDANTYTKSYPLLIDLGGDDVHEHPAGSADALTTDREVVVTIDRGGNDVYVAPVEAGVVRGQGVGIAGIGIVVDSAGNDSYTSADVAETSPPTTNAAVGQGYGVVGAGILVDEAGSDSYLVVDRVSSLNVDGFYGVQAGGQGVAALGGLAALYDGGAGDDSYAVQAEPSIVVDRDGWIHPGTPTAVGYGMAAIGASALQFDGGGSDRASAIARSAPVAPDDLRRGFGPSAASWAFGYAALGSSGISLWGEGDTIRTVSVTADAPLIGGVGAGTYGIGEWIAFGGIDDRGGNDTYSVDAVARAVQTERIDDACRCSGAVALVGAAVFGVVLLAHGSGSSASGNTESYGVVRDGSGSDAYVAHGETFARATALDERTVYVPPPPERSDDEGAKVYAGAGIVIVRTQGSGYSDGSVNQLVDLDGAGTAADLYVTEAVVDSRGIARVDLPGLPEEATVEARYTYVGSQGWAVAGATGELRDRGGIDAYRIHSTVTAVAEPETGSVIWDPPNAYGQAFAESFGTALLMDVDGAASDTFAMEPAGPPPCHGTRGQDVWVGCPDGLGFGWGVNR